MKQNIPINYFSIKYANLLLLIWESITCSDSSSIYLYCIKVMTSVTRHVHKSEQYTHDECNWSYARFRSIFS